MDMDLALRATDILDRLLAAEGRQAPDDYLTADLESCPGAVGHGAYNPEHCLVAQVGCAAVTGGVIDPNMHSFWLDWTGYRGVPDDDTLHQLIEHLRHDMAFKKGVPTGKVYRVSLERMKSGRKAQEVLREIFQFLTDHANRGYVLVGFNVLRFDLPAVFNNFVRANIGATKAEMDGLYEKLLHGTWDVGLIVKAAVEGTAPKDGESRLAFFERVDRIFCKKKWSLEGVAMPTFRITERYGIRPDEMHDGGIDCLPPHLVFHSMKEIIRGKRTSGQPG